MRASTIKLSKPDRLKIKKKLLLLMNIPFELTQHASPSRVQYSKCQVGSEQIVPYPYSYWINYFNRRNSSMEVFGISRQELVRSEMWTDYPNRYMDSTFVPAPMKKYELSDEPSNHWYIGDIEYIKSRKSIVVQIDLKRNRGNPWSNAYRKIRLRYGIETKRLNITSDVQSNYDVNKMLEIINTVLYGLFIH